MSPAKGIFPKKKKWGEDNHPSLVRKAQEAERGHRGKKSLMKIFQERMMKICPRGEILGWDKCPFPQALIQNLEIPDIVLPPYLNPYIGEEMKERLSENRRLRKSMIKALREVRDYLKDFDDASFEAVVEKDMEDPSIQRNVIKVVADIETVEEWKEIEKNIRERVRNAEEEGMMIYTLVERKH